MTEKKHIVIIGAGIIGLAAATELAELGEYDLSIIASHFPSDYKEEEAFKDGYLYDYTSLWAGAHYRPFPYISEQGKFEQELTRVTYNKFKQLAEQRPESSIKFMKGYDLLEAPSPAYLNLQNGYNREFLGLFRTIQGDKKLNIKFGAEYDTWSVNSPKLLKFLSKQLLNKNVQGGTSVKFIRGKIAFLSEVFALYANDKNFIGVIDCSGCGLPLAPKTNSRTSGFYDDDSFLIRGQTLLLQSDKLKNTSYYNKTITYQTINPSNKAETDWTFIIPRPPLNSGIFILGGTKQLDQDKNIYPTKNDREAILSRAQKYFPELFKNGKPIFTIKKNIVGFRPARKGGYNISKKLVGSGDKKFVISNYGAGGMGYELSFGAAAKIVQLIKEPTKTVAKL